MDQALLLNLIAPALTAHEAESAGATAPTVAARARSWRRAGRWVRSSSVGRRQAPATSDDRTREAVDVVL